MRFFGRQLTGQLPAGIAAALCLSLWACDDSNITGLGDTSGDPIQLSREITLSELEETLTSAAARLEIELFAEGLVAHRVILRPPEWLDEGERVAGRVADLTMGESGGLLTLTTQGLSVSFDAETRFGSGEEELSFTAFVDLVQGYLAEGLEPGVEAVRAPPDLPQAAADPNFLARKIRLLQESEGPAIEINVDLDNLEINADRAEGEPDGWLNVLGVAIELRISDGVTELVTEAAGEEDAVEFEGFVESVNVDLGYFTFTDGTQVFITENTQILEADAERPLTSLEEVHAALGEGLDVVSWGGGLLVSVEPRKINALELRFAVHTGDDDGGEIVEFEGLVVSVSLEDGSFTLTNGTIVRITDRTVLVEAGEGESLLSLVAVKEALESGFEVFAYGAGEVECADPLTLIALEMRFVLKSGDSNVQEFEGFVESVSMEGSGSFMLNTGTIVRMTEETRIKEPEAGQALFSLAAVSEALEAGQTVLAWGKGEVEGEEPLTLAAIEVFFVITE